MDTIIGFKNDIENQDYPNIRSAFSALDFKKFLFEQYKDYCESQSIVADAKDADEFIDRWNKRNGTRVVYESHGDKSCASAISAFRTEGISTVSILQMFLIISKEFPYGSRRRKRKNGEDFGPDYNPFMWFRKKIINEYEDETLSKSSELRFFQIEELFNEHFEVFKRLDPIVFLRQLLYSSCNGNTAVERAIFMPLLEEEIRKEGHKILLIDPSPDVMQDLLKMDFADNQIEVHLLFFSREIAEIYDNDSRFKTKFKSFNVLDDRYGNPSDFHSSDRVKHLARVMLFVKFDLIIYSGHDDNFKYAEQCFNNYLSSDPNKQTSIAMLIPQKWLDSSIELREAINFRILIDRFIILPPESFQNVGRKSSNTNVKKNVCITGWLGRNMDSFTIYRGHFYKADNIDGLKSGYITQEPWGIEVDSADFVEKGYNGFVANTITKLRNNALPTIPRSSSRSNPQRMEFSKEIFIWYSLSNGRGRFGYYELPDTEKCRRNKLNRGKAKYIKSLSAKDDEAAKRNIYKRLLRDPDLGDIISKDILAHYEFGKDPVNNPVSLLTYWFCRRNSLADKSNYNQEKLFAVFNNCINICNLMSNDKTTVSLLKTDLNNIKKSLKTAKEKKRFDVDSYLKQINIVLTMAKSESMFSDLCDLLTSYLKEKAKKNKGYNEARKGLVKKSYTCEEERKIVAYLKQRWDKTGDSKYLGALICFYTGCSHYEAAALETKDVVNLAGLQQYQFQIYMRFNPKGERVYIDVKQKEKYRRIPIVKELEELIKPQKFYLLKDSVPILKGEDGGYIKPEKIRQAKIEAVNSVKKGEGNKGFAKVTGITKETNFDDYSGDQFKTNARYHMLQTCSMTNAETNYLMGLTQKETYAKHYCDFTNDFVQIALKAKLERWSSQIENLEMGNDVKETKIRGNNTINITKRSDKKEVRAHFNTDGQRIFEDTIATVNISDDRGADVSIDVVEERK